MKKAKLLTIVLALSMAFVALFTFTACDLLGGNGDSSDNGWYPTTQLTMTAVNFVNVPGSERIWFMDVPNADSFGLSVANAAEEVVMSENLTRAQNTNQHGQIERALAGTALQRGSSYTVTVIAIGSGDFASSAPRSISITLTPEGTLVIGAMDEHTILFDQETRTLSWGGVENATSYDINISWAGGSMPTINSIGTTMQFHQADFGMIPYGDFITSVQGRAIAEDGFTVVRGEAASRTFQRTQQQQAGPTLTERMIAFAEWESFSKVALGTALRVMPNPAPTVNSIEGVDISGNTVTVFASITNQGAAQRGSVQFNISGITAEDTQARLDAVLAGITVANVVADSRNFINVAAAAPASIVTDLRNSTHLTGGLANITVADVIQGGATTPAAGSDRAFDVVGLVRATNGNFFKLGHRVASITGTAGTAEQRWAALATGANIASITERRFQQMAGLQGFMDLRAEFDAWLVNPA